MASARGASSAKAPRRPGVAVAFTVSWDGRLVERGLPEEPELFRELAGGGLLDELCITFRPCIVGGKSSPAITGLKEEFLPQGIALELLKLERAGNECVARYRVRAADRHIGRIGPI